MKNFKNLMKQAQEMQAKMSQMQEKLGDVAVDGQAGAGMVRVTLNGRHEAQSVKIDPSIVDKAEIEILEDLIVAAFNDAKTKVEAKVQEEMSKLTSGLPLGDLKLPF